MKNFFSLARQLISEHETNNPASILEQLGVKVFYVALHGIRGLYKCVEDVPEVFVSCNMEERETEFVLGHELAHYLLHRGENRIFLENRTLLKTSKAEMEADLFSICLMEPCPCDIILESETLQCVACRLGVPLSVADLYIKEAEKQMEVQLC